MLPKFFKLNDLGVPQGWDGSIMSRTEKHPFEEMAIFRQLSDESRTVQTGNTVFPGWGMTTGLSNLVVASS